jgi:ribosome-associated toxin RatA of RatAB toxin-antitoxin module
VKTRPATFLFLLATSLVNAEGPAPAAQPVAGLSPKEMESLNKGEVVVQTEVYTNAEGKRAAKGKAFAVVNAPPEQLWATITDYPKFSEFMPRLKRITVLQKGEGTLKVRQEVSVPLNTVSYTLDLKFIADARRMEWTIDKAAKNDIQDTFGSWEFVAYGEGKSLIRYTIAVDTGLFVPKFLEDYLVKKDLPEVLAAFRRRTESGGKWKKD